MPTSRAFFICVRIASSAQTNKRNEEVNHEKANLFTITGGTFRNSYHRQSAYVGAGWRWPLARHVSFTLLAGGSTGYKNLTGGFPVLPVIVPQLDIGHFSVSVLGTAVTASLRF